MIPYRGRRQLERGSTCSHTVERKCSELRNNLDVNEALRRFARLLSGFQDILVEMEALKPVRDRRISGCLFMESGNKSLIYSCHVVALGLPVHKQALWVRHGSGVFLNVQGVRFDCSPERIQFSMPNA
jgi:hypothetical protein